MTNLNKASLTFWEALEASEHPDYCDHCAAIGGYCGQCGGGFWRDWDKVKLVTSEDGSQVIDDPVRQVKLPVPNV